MNADKLFNLLGSIVTVAMITAVLQRGSQAALVIRALSNGFRGSITAALGR